MEEKHDYLFKLNVQPHTLKKYSNGKISELKEKIIPNIIFNSYSDLFSNPSMSNDELVFNMIQDYEEIVNSNDYKELIKITDEIVIDYKNITLEYKKGNGIYYSPEFLTKLDSAIEIRKELLSKFIVLNQANSKYSSSEVYEEVERIYDFNIDTKIDKGLDHLRRVRKIIMYINDLISKGTKEIMINYAFDTEVFTIKNVTVDEALISYKKIESQINDSKDKIGSIRINPIFKNLVLNTTDSMKSIEIITTYPNGTDDELDILLEVSNITDSKEVRTTCIASDEKDNSDFLEKTAKLADSPSRRGYLIDARNHGVTIINYSESKIEFR
ncbi:hypothetical protein NNC81_06025 [Streptococcus mutans]|uniref:hypothetical protein n=1 Tax=Streptococcus mutans TaxID=1309 RepID=UPI0002B59450|nr:hypothetical protein [Streptococcus mutans]EMC51109.1 hypothetical protein SMU102_03873 [Streptococcus mutans S1B]MCB4976890.1 hypothetical protein [Streptococcus mutans]MCB4993697.1 hypothetical protein [Streptococcus mutans]MDT9511115.1 hypothetical protein [Streptococcus mutans]MDT9529548.1 hypothetical protein [Streptococcus mutans]